MYEDIEYKVLQYFNPWLQKFRNEVLEELTYNWSIKVPLMAFAEGLTNITIECQTFCLHCNEYHHINEMDRCSLYKERLLDPDYTDFDHLFEVLGNHPLIVRSIPRYFNKHN
jgi:hypothetical protein